MEAKHISNLEQEVMNLVWFRPDMTVREIVNLICQSKPVAYTTILTVLQRLHEKGMVIRSQDNKAYTYSPSVSKESYSKTMAQSFLKKFFHSFGEIGIASFAQCIDSLSKRERDQLLHLLEQYDKAK